MKTKYLMIATVLFYCIIGLLLTFLPEEIVLFMEDRPSDTFTLTLQLCGALYIGFGIMNWLAKNSLIGGIYNRPLVLGNLMHFFISSFTLIKLIGNYSGKVYAVIMTVTICYIAFAISFGYLLKNSPKNLTSENE